MVQNKKDFWKKVLAEIQLEVTPMVFGTIFARIDIEEINENILFISCEDDFIKKNVEKKYFQIVQEAVNKINGNETNITFVIKKAHKEVTSAKQEGMGPLFQSVQDPEENLRDKIIRAGLSPKYAFENYIMGKSNQLAVAIANAVSTKPGEVYNPVFMYSGVGLGKTHLLQAIGIKVIKDKPGAKVVYTTGESFTNELIDAIQGGKGKGKYTTNDFRNKYRKADVLLIDDVQFIAGKEATQEEFFHTFNALYLGQKQIVITSDKPPKDFMNLEERIASRFNSGIIVDIQPPDIETRIAILRKRRDASDDPISNSVIDAIAESVNTNIRELEGAYIQVLSQATTSGKEIHAEQALQFLGKTVREKAKKSVNMNQILNAICNYYSIKSVDIKGKRRNKELVVPRQIAMYLIKQMTDTPYMSIGDFLGGRDHTTVMHGVDKIAQEIENHTKIRADVVNVKQVLLSE